MPENILPGSQLCLVGDEIVPFHWVEVIIIGKWKYFKKNLKVLLAAIYKSVVSDYNSITDHWIISRKLKIAKITQVIEESLQSEISQLSSN